ncbi:MAG: hypothetical protein K0S68_462 [Candidatus Saccharibacteria bacterium]|jgi:hypothetical protein|nr:hypothetical protein [Candidatus Saccharibacteria bacterium]
MQEIRKRERPQPPELRDQVVAFARTALPPLVAKYAMRWLKLAYAIPQVRAAVMIIAGIMLGFLIVPALVIGVLAFVATGDSATATVAALTMTILAGVLLGVILAKLYSRWKAFRLRYFGIR